MPLQTADDIVDSCACLRIDGCAARRRGDGRSPRSHDLCTVDLVHFPARDIEVTRGFHVHVTYSEAFGAPHSEKVIGRRVASIGIIG